MLTDRFRAPSECPRAKADESRTAREVTTIALADDQHLVRAALRALLKSNPESTIVGEAANGLEALELVERRAPDVLILDLIMPEMDGLEVTKRVHRHFPRTRVVILSVRGSENSVLAALRNGATGYVFKTATKAMLIQAIHEALRGRRYLSPPLSEALLEANGQAEPGINCSIGEPLTVREQEVLQLALRRLTNAEVARKLGISVTTVASHRADIMCKLGLHNQAELVRYALDRGIQPLDGQKRPVKARFPGSHKP